MSYFGTDGIRGKFGEFPIYPEFLLKLGFATGQVLMAHTQHVSHRPNVVIGKDTRLSGYVIEACLQAGFNAAGVDVHMLGVIPTPAIAHLTRSFHADAGVVISASHNPFYDNGVKFFSRDGKKLSDALQNAINQKLAELDGQPYQIDGLNLGRHYRIDDAKGRYIEFCKGSFPYQLSLEGLTIVVDCANGAGYGVAPRVLRELGAKVIAIGNEPNGININDNIGSTHIETLQKAVIEHKADLGFALDGDGDRIIMVDENGQAVDGDAILYILATQADHKTTGVVGTLMSNMGLQLTLEKHGIDFVRTNVGDRYVMQALDKHGWQLGGEPSGHILTLDKACTGDAIVAGLQVLSVIAKTGKSLATLTQGLSVLPQKLVNVKLSQKQDPYANPILATQFQKAQEKLAGRGRLLIRQSGTEALIRVMVESDDDIECDTLACELADAIKTQLD
ncbi:phosphoglucosamine mutase [Moraxella macacae 0408225]|uniref:Phosphoglucosamine mutase n=1 Tax=Moraxella macacae 0408225 TaxID=1230338 RepID=L2F5B8_9GAMM|nr:phosphoglucosamine mutase [Moraxella macacae]ELA08249.1 phosphoglucosamine mutase [Moraxella macacae 0408225]